LVLTGSICVLISGFGWFPVTRAEVVVSPPFVFLPQVKGLLPLDFAVAAQNCCARAVPSPARSGCLSLFVLNFDVSWLALW
jgi:triosephosphate isomerase